MSAPAPAKSPRLWRPSVAAAILYVALFTLFVLWMMSSLGESEFSDFVLRPRLLGLSVFHILSGANALLLTVLLLDVGAARRSESVARRAQFWGLLLAILMVAGVQAATFSMRNAAQTLAAPGSY